MSILGRDRSWWQLGWHGRGCSDRNGVVDGGLGNRLTGPIIHGAEHVVTERWHPVHLPRLRRHRHGRLRLIRTDWLPGRRGEELGLCQVIAGRLLMRARHHRGCGCVGNAARRGSVAAILWKRGAERCCVPGLPLRIKGSKCLVKPILLIAHAERTARCWRWHGHLADWQAMCRCRKPAGGLFGFHLCLIIIQVRIPVRLRGCILADIDNRRWVCMPSVLVPEEDKRLYIPTSPCSYRSCSIRTFRISSRNTDLDERSIFLSAISFRVLAGTSLPPRLQSMWMRSVSRAVG
jgi:hypothetical protein